MEIIFGFEMLSLVTLAIVMKLHIFEGEDSFDYAIRLGHIACIETSSWGRMLFLIFEKRCLRAEDWESEKDYGIDWIEKPFVKLLCQKRKDVPQNSEDDIRDIIRDVSSDPKEELFCKEVVLSMNQENDNIDPLLLVEEIEETLPLLKYLGVIGKVL